MGDETKQGGFDIDFKLIMPELQVKLWTLALDADTSKVNLAYKPGAFTTSLAYNYGGAVEASLMVRRFSTTLGVDPSNGNVDLGMHFRGFKFSASTSLTQPTLGVGVAYGASLLPFPTAMTGTFMAAAGGMQSMVGNLGSAGNNPLGWYGLHSNDVTAITKAIALGQSIQKSGSGDRFGFGLRLNYLPLTGLTIYGGAQYRF